MESSDAHALTVTDGTARRGQGRVEASPGREPKNIMNINITRRALGGLCAVVLGLTGLGAGAMTAIAQTAQPDQAQNAASQSPSSSAGAKGGYTLTGADGQSAPVRQSASDDAFKAATTPQQGAPDLKNVKTLPDTIALSEMFHYEAASTSDAKPDGADALAPNGGAASDVQAPAAATGAKAGMTLYPKTVTHQELSAKRAIAIHADGFAAGEAIKYEVAGPGDPLYNMTEYFAGYADKNGRWINTISYLDADYARKGDYTVKLTGLKSGASVEDKYTITDEPAALPAGSAKVVLASDSITQHDMRYTGMKYTASGFKAGESVKIYAVTSLGDAQLIDDAKADANGEVSDAVTASTAVGLTGAFRIVAVGSDPESGSAAAGFDIVADDDPFKDAKNRKAADTVKLTIEPKRISQYALGLQGVKFTVDGMQKDEQVEFILTDPNTGFQVWYGMTPTTYPKPVEGQYYSPMYDTSLAAKPGTYEVKVVGSKSGYVTGSYEVYDDTSVKIDPKIEPTGDFAKHVRNGIATMTQSELLADGAISFKATGYVPGDYTESYIVNPNGSQMPAVSGLTGDDGTYVDDGSWWKAPNNFGNRSGYNNALVPGDYTLVVADHYAKNRIYSQIVIKVTDDSKTAPRGKVAVSSPSISAYDLYKTGLKLEVSGFNASEPGSLLITTPNGTPAVASPLTLNAEGVYTGTFKGNDPEGVQAGEYKVAFYINDTDHPKQETTFTVTDERAPEATIGVKLSADTLTQSEFSKTGLGLSATGLDAYQYGDVRITEPDGNTVIATTLQADVDGNIKLAAPLKRVTDTAQPGKWTIQVKTKDYHHGEATFTVTGSNKPAGVDKNELRQLVDKAQSLRESDYTADSWAGLGAPLAAAKSVLAKTDATQAQVNIAWGDLNDAIGALVKKAGSGDNGGNGNNSGDSGNTGNTGNTGNPGDNGADAGGNGTHVETGDDGGSGTTANSPLASTGTSVVLLTAGALLTLVGGVALAKARKERA